jgi:hypothetical protein
MSNFKQPIEQSRLRITSAFLPVELTCAHICICTGPHARGGALGPGHVPERAPARTGRALRSNLAFPIGIACSLTDQLALDRRAAFPTTFRRPGGCSSGIGL